MEVRDEITVGLFKSLQTLLHATQLDFRRNQRILPKYGLL